MNSLLVVDDYPSSREALIDMLNHAGYRCLAAADGNQAMEAVRAHRVDLVLLDINMPRMSGMQVLQEIRQRRSPVELPVIMTTGDAASQAVVDALSAGANDYVTKPIDLSALLARVRTQLQIRDLARLKDEFLSIASHDLKNPLTAVLGAVDTLGEDFPVGAVMTPEGRWLIETATRRTQQMIRIITDFLDMQAAEDGRLTLRRQAVDLCRLVEQALQDNRDYGQRKGITLTLLPSPLLPEVPADEARISQVVENLLGNAIKFGPPGCRVEIATLTDENVVTLEVRDTGPGIPPEDVEKLFVKGASRPNQPTGNEVSSGLGLSYCKQLIELHGGRIGVRPGEGGGSVFWFQLPRAAPR